MLQKYEAIFLHKVTGAHMGTNGHRWKQQPCFKTGAHCQRLLPRKKGLKIVDDGDQEYNGEHRVYGVSKPPGHGYGWGSTTARGRGIDD